MPGNIPEVRFGQLLCTGIQSGTLGLDETTCLTHLSQRTYSHGLFEASCRGCRSYEEISLVRETGSSVHYLESPKDSDTFHQAPTQ